MQRRKGLWLIPKNLLPDGYKWCIAGGWAACPALASDQDVWVYDRFSAAQDMGVLLSHLALQGFHFSTDMKDQAKTDDSYGDERTEIYKVAVVENKPNIHLMLTNAPSIMDILNGFDVSTHQVAIASEGFIVKGNGWTPVSECPVMLLNNPQTPARLAKIQERYGF